ncbi:MAG: Glutaminase, partial [Phycisphaerales bacterium]|nr:Glutaminase [Phycisphaerales bacterium]
DDANVPRAVNNNQPVMAMAFNFGTVSGAHIQQHVIVAYDEIKAINYFGEALSPYWARNGTTFNQMMATASNNYATYVTKTAAFDTQLMTDMTTEGGANYAQIGALAYRQTFTATGLAADPSGQLLAFPKENSSNGDVSTVDVLYPMFPQLLLFSPTVAKASLQPVMDYANSSLWHFDNAPHDLGTYPLVLGRPDGGEEMPVEETANMLIMLDGIAKAEGSSEYADQFWPLISKWANFLKPYANTPGLQLTTDDFLGVITNSTNLAVKAIIGLGAFADLARRHGDTATANSYTAIAQADVTHWMNQSISSDGTHWLLSYGQQGSGAQMYNLVFDQILGTNLFPASVAAKDIAYDKTVLTPLGVPIRSTTNIVGIDWSIWDASLATNAADFQTLITPIYTYLNTTGTRVPMRDKYDTSNLNGGLFQARSVVGGVFAKMLTDPAMWSKYSSQDTNVLGPYAGFPVTTAVVPSGNESPQTWRFTTVTPPGNFMVPGFNDSAWASGQSGFGTAITPNLIVNTVWNSPDIWMRRKFTMPAGTFSNLQFEVFHDEDVEIYVNGLLAATDSGYTTGYTTLPITDLQSRLQLVAGKTITLAVHCHQTTGGQGVDVGLVTVQPGVR